MIHVTGTIHGNLNPRDIWMKTDNLYPQIIPTGGGEKYYNQIFKQEVKDLWHIWFIWSVRSVWSVRPVRESDHMTLWESQMWEAVWEAVGVQGERPCARESEVPIRLYRARESDPWASLTDFTADRTLSDRSHDFVVGGRGSLRCERVRSDCSRQGSAIGHEISKTGPRIRLPCPLESDQTLSHLGLPRPLTTKSCDLGLSDPVSSNLIGRSDLGLSDRSVLLDQTDHMRKFERPCARESKFDSHGLPRPPTASHGLSDLVPNYLIGRFDLGLSDRSV